ncbi:hypothetical protein EPD60_14010 [Flaviaesturariibacter flavus]|uniref:Uncharacterized protein n=1 Tax=Flaviaesturariibacter flavus TaxID=2502780 RepID=A0A4R1B7J5_9BACT|nr:hypothetical protein [Flaviaesturariibacter flavus]TCJ13017.1 hypothetical protein EPD60_14010 [Flaviaesturariibacter flavus]
MNIEKQLQTAGVLNHRISAELKKTHPYEKRLAYGNSILTRKTLLLRLNRLSREKGATFKYNLSYQLRNLDLVDPNSLRRQIDQLKPSERVKKMRIDASNVIHLKAGTRGAELKRHFLGGKKKALSKKQKEKLKEATAPISYNPIIPSGVTQ